MSLQRIAGKFVEVLVFLGVKIIILFFMKGHCELVRIASKFVEVLVYKV